MKKVVSILLPLAAVVLLLVGCGKSNTMGEKKTVSEVDQLLTKKGQKFYDDLSSEKFEVVEPNKVKVKNVNNNTTTYINFKKAGYTKSKKYMLYNVSSSGNGGYNFLNDEKVAIIISNVKGNKYLSFVEEKDSNYKKTVKLTNETIDKFAESVKNLNRGIKIEE